MSLQSQITDAITSLQESATTVETDAAVLDAIANGPATGPSSIVSTTNGPVKTAARVIAELADGSAFAVKDFSNLEASALARVAPPGATSFTDAVSTAMSTAFPALALTYVGRPQIFIGTLNGTTGLITLQAGGTRTIATGVGTKGELVRVSVAGTYAFDGLASHSVGDEYYFDGTVWDKLGGSGTGGTTISLPASTSDARIAVVGKAINGLAHKYQVVWTADNRLLIWGDNASFVFSPAGDRPVAYEVGTPWASTVTVEAIYCFQTYILIQTNESTGNLYHMGSTATYGQGGNASTTGNVSLPTKITKFTTDAVRITKVWGFANFGTAEEGWFALTTAGNLYSCGYSGAQQAMGYNSTTNLSTPRKMTRSDGTTALANIIGVACASIYAPIFAWGSDGKAYVWGNGLNGAHGQNSTSALTWPTPIETTFGSGIARTDIAMCAVAGCTFSVSNAAAWLLTTAGKVLCAGSNAYGNGNGVTLGATNQTTFTAAIGAIDAKVVSKIVAGGGSTPACAALTTDGLGYYVGHNGGGQIGTGSVTDQNQFIAFGTLPSGFSGALTDAYIAGSYTGSVDAKAVFLEATNAGVKTLCACGYDVNYCLGTGLTGVTATSRTFQAMRGARGTLQSWGFIGIHAAMGVWLLNSESELRYAGANDQSQSGVHSGVVTDIDSLQPVRLSLPRLLKVPILIGDYSSIVTYSYNDEVNYQGSCWRYIYPTSSSGNAPPTLPTNSNTYWRIVAQKGDAGYANLVFDFDNGTADLIAGGKLRVPVSFDCTIVGWTLFSDVAGSAVVDLWKSNYASYPPTSGNSITASAKPTLSGANKATDTLLTGWTTAIAAGDILIANIVSTVGMTDLVLTLKVQRT